MEYTFNEEEARVLHRFLARNLQSNVVNAVYISPAAQLRNQANQIEQDERDQPLLREILKKLQITNHQ